MQQVSTNEHETLYNDAESVTERVTALYNQRTFVEVLEVEHDEKTLYSVEVKTLSAPEYDVNEAQAADGKSVFYHCDKLEDALKIASSAAERAFDDDNNEQSEAA